MSATADTAHLSAAERQALIDRLREFGHQQEESQQLSDQGSLERAADLIRLYEDKAWMDELPAPGRRSKVPPDDFRRFTKWATEDERLGLKARRISQLKTGAEVAQILRRGGEIANATETSLRPLKWMVANDYAGRMDEVWRDAVQLAGGDSPSESEVKRALSDWKRRNIPKPDKAAAVPKPKGNRARVQRWRSETEQLLTELPQVAAPVLRELLSKYEDHKASIPPMEEW